MSKTLPKLLFGLASLLGVANAPAEDIDLFSGAVQVTSVPNVLIIVDNTANWGSGNNNPQPFTNEKTALAATLAGLDTYANGDAKFSVGIMFSAETGNPNNNVDGGYVRAAVRPMNSANKPIYQAFVNSIDSNGDKGNGGKSSLVMAEAYRYLSGGAPIAGNGKAKTDYTGNTFGTAQSKAVYALTGNALTSVNGTVYNPPNPSACSTYVIYVSNGPAQDNTTVTTQSNTYLTQANNNTTVPQISLTPSGSQGNMMDEWSKFMFNKLGVVTYTVDINPTFSGQGPGWTALLHSMADVSTGKYFAVDSAGGAQAIALALNQIFTEIQAKNSAFASASLPISVNTQGTYLNEVFIGMFRPDANAAPRWPGNLKRYQFKAFVQASGIELRLVDADQALAINNNTGFITQCARSFWTPALTSPDTYWSYAPSGLCPNAGPSNTPDGDVVEKGGIGYGLRALPVPPTSGTRTVKTCDPTSCSSLTDFAEGNTAITQSLLGVTTSTARTNLIYWTIGKNVVNEAGKGTSVMRPSIHGDVVHSRPVAVDYGSGTGVVVYYGSNDGALHAVNGNRQAADLSVLSEASVSIGGIPPGGELWSFIAPEHYGRLKRLYDNSPAITFPSPPNDPTNKPYFFDGPISAYQSGSTVWLYASQRRGGRMLYAFNVSNPASPSFKWRAGCTTPLNDDSGCVSADYNQMGQSWSAPKILKSAGYGAGASPMLVFGGGYDTCEDYDNGTTNNTCSSPKGNRIYVLDANTGSVLKTFTTERSVVGEVTVVNNTTTNLAVYAYAADTGGNLYRIAIGSDVPANWTMTKIADLGCSTIAACNPNRKFLFGPEVVVTPGYNAVLLGSGDREHPLLSHTATQSVTNQFFMVKDNPADSTWLTTENATCGADVICLNSLAQGSNTTPVDPNQVAVKKGWAMALSNGEQVATSAVVVYGNTTFSTFTPTPPTVCGANLGSARVYSASYLDGSAGAAGLYQPITGGGLPPSPVSGLVTVLNPSTGQPMTVPFIIGADPNSPLQVKMPSGGGGTAGNKERVYWYIRQQ